MASTATVAASERQPLLSNSSVSRPPKAQRNVAFSDAPSREGEAASSSSSSAAAAASRTPASTFAFPSSPTRSSPFSDGTAPPHHHPSQQHGAHHHHHHQQQQQSHQPMLSSLNSKLRRRNSAGAPLMAQRPALTGPKIGPQRTTKTTQKLTLLPNPEDTGDEPDEESGRDVYSQFTRIKDPTARRDAARLGKADRERLPRVTAYCTASSYNLDALLKFLKSRTKTRSTAPKQFDECIYTPWDYGRSKDRRSSSTQGLDRAGESDVLETIPGPVVDIPPARERRRSDSALEIEEHTQARRGDLLDLRASPPVTSVAEDGESSRAPRDMVALRQDTHDAMNHPDFDIMVHTPEVFFFEYGTVVIWGMTLAQEKRLLKDLAKFEIEKLAPDDVETEDFNFYYTREYQARIYNDFISLRDRRNYMTKLAISHALAQSVKTSLFEDLLSTTIADTTPLPGLLASTGRISLSRKEINKKIGELFILRINIHLQGSVLDSPELMWAEPQLEPVYAAMRSYLEMDQRVELMTERLSVLGDLLAVLRDQAGTRHGEWLEWIVIVLIGAEILVAGINIVVDLYAGE